MFLEHQPSAASRLWPCPIPQRTQAWYGLYAQQALVWHGQPDCAKRTRLSVCCADELEKATLSTTVIDATSAVIPRRPQGVPRMAP
jgi:hypothetical protein